MNNNTATTSTPTITLVGPDLNDRDYNYHIHGAGCADLAHYGKFSKKGGDMKYATTCVIGSLQEVIELYFDDFKNDEDDMWWLNWTNEFKVFPCAGDFPTRRR